MKILLGSIVLAVMLASACSAPQTRMQRSQASSSDALAAASRSSTASAEAAAMVADLYKSTARAALAQVASDLQSMATDVSAIQTNAGTGVAENGAKAVSGQVSALCDDIHSQQIKVSAIATPPPLASASITVDDFIAWSVAACVEEETTLSEIASGDFGPDTTADATTAAKMRVLANAAETGAMSALA